MEAQGDIILYRAADDHLMPDSISHAQEAFAQKPDATIAFGETIFFQDDPSDRHKRDSRSFGKTRGFLKKRIASSIGFRTSTFPAAPALLENKRFFQ